MGPSQGIPTQPHGQVDDLAPYLVAIRIDAERLLEGLDGADSIIHSPSQRSEDHAILRERRGMVWFVTQEKAQAFLSLDEVAVLFRSGCTLHQYASIAPHLDAM